MTKIGLLVANGLTLLRLGLAFYFPFARPDLFLWLIVVALASEFFDGLVARAFNAESTFGRLMDPVADKFFILSVMVTLVLHGKFEIWQILLITSRDLLIIYAMCVGMLTQKWERIKRLKPRWSGKIATTAQFALLLNAFLPVIPMSLLFWIAVSCSMWASWDYYQLYKSHAV